ncbi:MAG: thiamine diphosphokinase [Anaerolineales bacterium]|nr:thiamine diphosphokinase [Anaerolineales bacterium]
MRAVVFVNGKMDDPQGAKALLKPDDLIIAADGGAVHCRTLNISPDVVIGDMDSLPEGDQHFFADQGVIFIRHDRRKDETDLELALLHARDEGANEVLVLGALGGRWDQSFANLLLPIYHRLTDLEVSYWHADTWIYVINTSRTIRGAAGQTVSLIPIGGDARGVSTSGLGWPLDDETLFIGGSRGVSNLLIDEKAEIHVQQGTLLCFVFDPQDK